MKGLMVILTHSKLTFHKQFYPNVLESAQRLMRRAWRTKFVTSIALGLLRPLLLGVTDGGFTVRTVPLRNDPFIVPNVRAYTPLTRNHYAK
jgi:hypothetical protein